MSETVDLIISPPKPSFSMKRTECPFYGFSFFDRIMVDSGDNQCALKASSQSPCSMEISGCFPEWKKCTCFSWKTEWRALEKMADKVRIFPSEFYPSSQSEWSGMPLLWWFYYTAFKGA